MNKPSNLPKTIFHSVALSRKEVPGKLHDVRVLPLTNGNGSIFVVANLETKNNDLKETTKCLDEITFHLDTLAAKELSEKSIETDFEHQMQTLNDNLFAWLGAHPEALDITRSGVVIVVLCGTKLVITGFGQIGSMFLHNIPEGDEAHDLVRDIRREAAPTAEKLFRTVMMGSVEPGDRAIFGNAALLRLMPKEDLANILSTLPASSAAEKIIQMTANGTENIAAIILKSVEPVASTNTSAKVSVEELHRAETRTENVLTRAPRTIKELSSNLGNWLFKAIKNGSALLLTLIISFFKLAFESIKTVVMMAFGKGHAEKAKKQFHELLTNCRERIATKNTVLNWPARIIYLLLIVLIVYAALSVSFYISNKKTAELLKTRDDAMTLVKSLESEAESKLIYGDDAGAKTALDSAEQRLSTDSGLKDHPFWNEAQSNLIRLRKDLRKEYTLSTQPAFTLPNNGLRLGIFDGKVSAITEKGELMVNGSEPVSSSLTPHFAWFGNNSLYSMDVNGTVSEIAADGSAKTQQGVFPNTLVDATMYSGRVYGINPVTSSIVRIDPLTGGFGTAKTWQKGEVKALAEARSIAIDTDVYIAIKDNILKFSRSFPADFKLGSVDPSLTDIKCMWTSDKSSYLYLLEPSAHRVVVIDKGNGAYVKQFLFNGTEGVSDFLVDEASRQIYLLTGKQILNAGL
ncbi:MAG: hypothetical protein WCJ29_00045 [bacterium]